MQMVKSEVASHVGHGIGPSFTARLVGNCVVLWWRREITIAGIHAVDALFRRARTTQRCQVAFLTIISPDANIQTSTDVRTALAVLLKAHDKDIAAAAIAYEATGFKATAARSIITAINLASGSSFPNRVFATAEPACLWLSDKLKETSAEARELHRQVEALR